MLDKNIQRALEVMGYEQLTPIQEMVIPHLLEKTSVAVQARTGSGKTASFAIPICEKIDWEGYQPQALILTCTRELAEQVKVETSHIGRLKKLKVQTIIGKERMQFQIDALRQKTHIVVATPGRLMDHIRQGTVNLSELKYVVLDEADYMLDMGFIDEVDEILEYVPHDICMALFSATYPDRIQSLVKKRMPTCEFVKWEEEANILHYYQQVNDKEEAFLNALLQMPIESALVFCDMQVDVDDLFSLCLNNGIKAVKLHGGLIQSKRFDALEAFKKGKVRILIATDVAARGIDIDKVTHIIHYQAPHTLEEYTHRCGRTARKDLDGISLLLMEKKEMAKLPKLQKEYHFEKWDKPQVHKDHSYLKGTIKKENKQAKWNDTIVKLFVGAGKDKKVRANDIIGAFCSVDGVEMADIGVIEVLQKMSYVEILNGKEKLIVNAFKNKTIKNKIVKVQIAKS